MDFKVTSAKTFGNGGGQGWVQVHDFTPSDRLKLSKRGRLFAVISGVGVLEDEGQNVDKVFAGRQILMRLHEQYYEKTEKSAYYALKDAVKKVYEEFSGQFLDIEIAALVFLDGVVYSTVSEGAFVCLYREGTLVKILEGGGQKTISASGHPGTGDIIIAGSSDFISNVGQGFLKEALSKKDLSDIAETIVPGIRSLEDGSRSGAVFVKFEKVEDSEILPTITSENSGVQEKDGVGSEKFEKRIDYSTQKPIKQKIASIFPKLARRGIRIKGGEVDEATSKRRKLAVSVGLILLVLLLVSIFFGIQTKKKKDKMALFEDTISEATHLLEEAVSLYELNPIRSRELFSQSKRKVENLLEDGIDYPEVYVLRDKIAENESKILGEYRVDSQLFLDLTLLSEGFVGNSLSASKDVMVVLDGQNKRLVSIEIDTKRTEIVAGEDELNDPKNTAVYAGRFFVFDRDSIYEISKEGKEIVEEGFGNDDLISSFAGNIYVLSKSDSQIYRIAGSQDGFSDKSEWLSEGAEPDFSDAVSWSIDGNIWVLASSGEVLRFSLGNEINFVTEGVFPPIDSGLSIFTDEDSEHLYILEPENGRTVVLDKEGKYVAQYISDSLVEGKSMVVSEGEKKAIILTGEKLLSIELKHLE